MAESRGRVWAGTFAAVLLVLLFVGQMVLVTNREVITNDEGYHLYAGVRYWECGDFGVNPEHPPLAKIVAALPLRVMGVAVPVGACPVANTAKGVGYGDSDGWLYEGGKMRAGALLIDRVVPLARRAMLVWAVLLAGAAFVLTRRLFGESAALVGLGLIAFEPTLVGHGGLVTTDMALSAAALVGVAAWWSLARRGGWWRVVVAGLACGLCLAVKHSGVLIVPVLACLGVAEVVNGGRGGRGRRMLRQVLLLIVVVGIGVGVLWGTYGFRFAARPGGVGLTLSLADFIAATQAQGNRSVLLTVIPWCARWHLLPEAYLYGFVDVLSISNPGQASFLLGHLYPHGVPQYFPAVVLIKSTLGMLGLGVVTGIVMLLRRARLDVRVVYLGVIPVVWMAAGMVSTLNIGYRHILPVIAPVCCLLGAAMVWVWRCSGVGMRVALGALVAAHATASVAAFPNEIAFANVAFGGVTGSHAVLTDSNNDWSQALPQLATWLRVHAVKECWLAYDGMARPGHSGIGCRQMVPNLFGVYGEPPARVATGTFVISGLSLSGIEWERPDLNPYADFKARRPVAVVGGADMVYQGTFDMTREVAVHRTVQATMWNGDGKYKEAEGAARAALELTPTSALAHLQLANALKGLGRRGEAHAEYGAALRIAGPLPQWYFLSLPEMRRGELETR